MRRSIWIPLLGVLIALAIIFFIFFASRPEPGPVAGDVPEGNGVVATDDGVEAVPETGEAAPETDVESGSEGD